jgi:hypothetical protein
VDKDARKRAQYSRHTIRQIRGERLAEEIRYAARGRAHAVAADETSVK